MDLFTPEALKDAGAIRSALDRAGYDSEVVKGLRHGLKGASPLGAALMDRRTAPPGCLNTLLRLLHLGKSVRYRDAINALGEGEIGQLMRAGVLTRSGDFLQSHLKLERIGELALFCDFFDPFGQTPLRADYVMGVAPSSIMLAALTPRRAVETTCDMGTGGGYQALLAAKHSERVIATDISPRCLNLAALNAKLNGVENVEFRLGSFFEPIGEECFELVIANPPFVISPGSRLIYRDGSMGGDLVSERTVRDAALHLEEGGMAVMLANWHHASDDDWALRPKQWIASNHCDARWMRFDDDDPWTYAASWLQQEEQRDEEASGRILDEWAQYHQSLGIQRIALGAVVLRKRTATRNWARCDDIPITTSLNACGDQIERIFDAEDLLSDLPEEHLLLDRRFRVHPAHRVDQALIVRDGEWTLESCTLHLTNGMDFCAKIDMPTMQFLGALDGHRTVREAALPVAEGAGVAFDQVIPVCLDITKRLLRMGLLTIA
jgi:methylase of polypeptide subunit release factors